MLASDRRRLKLGVFVWGAGEGLFFYLLPLYIRSLGGGATAVGLAYAIQFAIAAASVLLAGPVVDRLGHILLIRGAVLVGIPGAVLWLVAPNWQWIIAGMVFYAISFGGMPAISGYIAAAHDDQVGALGSIFAFFSLGMVVGPTVGGFVAVQLHSIRPVFGLALAALVVVTIVLWGLTPHPAPHHEPLGVGLRAAGGNRRLLVLSAYMAALLATMSITSNFLGPYLQDVDRASDALVGFLGSCTALGEFLIGLSIGRINRLLGRVGTLLALQVALAISLVLLLQVRAVPVLALAFLLRGAIMTSFMLGYAFVGVVSTARQHGTGSGVVGMANEVGMMVGAYAGGWLYAGGPTRPLMASLVALGVMAAVTIVIIPFIVERGQVYPSEEGREMLATDRPRAAP
jgi:MFS family permease